MYKMDSVQTENSPSILEIKNEHRTQEEESAENFQKFIYDLFEKNGVLNDLRAYLRKHIVDVLRSANLGDTPSCQKHFAQRLELTVQAINILIAEYLLRFEFSYTLSVFISEIPLANMVFDFAGALMKGDANRSQLRFKDKDVYSILNYLGMKLDADHLGSVYEMYKKETHTPLLLCILKCLPMYQFQRDVPSVQSAGTTSEESMLSNISTDTLSEKPWKKRSYKEKCRHYTVCKTCHTRLVNLKERYRKKKKEFVKEESSLNSVNVKTLMNNMNVVEGTFIDEIFEQLKSVYEAELEMMRIEEQKKVKRSLATHALQLMQHRQEMEEQFKAREEELERNVMQKKKFLWGLARSLREQHEQMTRAMQAVKQQTHTLTSKEDNLRTQLLEAEQELKRRGEEMREQISSELVTLEGHLDDMKRERDSLHREKSELEQLRLLHRDDSKEKNQTTEQTNDSRMHYEILKNELAVLKKYVEASRLDKKHVKECSTMTDSVPASFGIEVLNNEQVPRTSREEDRIKTSQLINDFKKHKNVNFFVGNSEDLYPDDRRECASSDVMESPVILQLRQENERLRDYARLQQSQIDRLCRGALGAGPGVVTGPRPRTAPPATPAPLHAAGNAMHVNTTGSANSFGWRKGAGEELSFSNTPPAIVLPGDAVPFIGVLRERHDTRRYLINQWRALRRVSPSRPHCSRNYRGANNISSPPVQLTPEHSAPAPEVPPEDPAPEQGQSNPVRNTAPSEQKRNREKSPKSMLREAKEKLKTKSTPKYLESSSTREKSPSSVLREAKLRLRKLEIEAEAVEKSYLDFRKRQNELRPSLHPPDEALVTKDTGELSVKRSRSLQKISHSHIETVPQHIDDTQKLIHEDFDKYLREYHAKFDLSDSHFNKNSVTARAKPIPHAFSPKNASDITKFAQDISDYLETPLPEFRKYYQAGTTRAEPKIESHDSRSQSPAHRHERHRSTSSSRKQQNDDTEAQNDDIGDKNAKELEAKKDALMKEKNFKKVELEILKNNINKIYNMEPTDTTPEPSPTESNIASEPNVTKITKEMDNNILRIEVENLKPNVVETDPNDILVVVQSNVAATPLPQSDTDTDGEKDQITGNMTILISPKRSYGEARERSRSPQQSTRSMSPEQAAMLTRNDVFEAIFHADPAKTDSSHLIHPDSSKEHVEDSRSVSEGEKDSPDRYTDDFSADVDNYNTLSENMSPVSIPKSPTDENFWDS